MAIDVILWSPIDKNMHVHSWVLAGIALALLGSGFFVAFTKDYSKFSRFLGFDARLVHVMVGVLAGVAVYPERFSWEKKHDHWYTVRCVLGIAVVVAYTVRNLKHVRNLKRKLSNSIHASKATFWNSSYIKQEMQLLLGVVVGSIVFMMVANSRHTAVPIASLSAFFVLLLLQQTLHTVTDQNTVVNYLKQQKNK